MAAARCVCNESISVESGSLITAIYNGVFFYAFSNHLHVFFFFENKELSKIKRGARGTATQIAVDASCQTQEPPGGSES